MQMFIYGVILFSIHPQKKYQKMGFVNGLDENMGIQKSSLTFIPHGSSVRGKFMNRPSSHYKLEECGGQNVLLLFILLME